MLKRSQVPMFILMLISVLSLVSACGIWTSSVGYIPRGTPDHGNGTPAVVSTISLYPHPVHTVSVSTMGANYAFVRKNQLWVALNGANPLQVTNFNYTNIPNVFWHQPVWSPGDHLLAFIMNAHPAGLGGGGCPGPDYSANGALYLMNTSTGHFTRVRLSSPPGYVQMKGVPQDDFWQYMFWEDTTHLLAWYNGPAGKLNNMAGLYRYSIISQALTLVIPLSALNAATLFSPQKTMPLLLSMHYSNEQLFYQMVVHPFEQGSQLVIYRHSVVHPQMPSGMLLSMGTESWCTSLQDQAFLKPGWDISPNGEQLVAQMIEVAGSKKGTSTIQLLNLNDSSTIGLFAQAPAQFLAYDITVTWGPDNQTVVATTASLAGEDGPYSATLANPTAMQHYDPALAGQVAWRPDSAAFALQNREISDATFIPDVYVFLMGNSYGRLLLTDAHNFSWG